MRLGLAGDTMLGRGVAQRLEHGSPATVFAPELVAVAHEADAVVLNLECAVSTGGQPWPDPDKAFFFRAPPQAVDALAALGVSCVTLANNHALDYGEPALLDTRAHLAAAGIAAVGAGANLGVARAPAVLERRGFRLGVLGVADHPADFAAQGDRAGVAYADLRHDGVPGWLSAAVADLARDVDLVLVTPHWGPNMSREPVDHVRRAAAALREAGAGLVAGHSAHVVQGVQDDVLFDLGDFIDDYAVDLRLRNDVGLFFLVDLDGSGPTRLEAVPLTLDYCRTRLASPADAAWIRQRFRAACAELGTEVTTEDERLVITWPRA